MKCCGNSVAGTPVEVEFADSVVSVHPTSTPQSTFLAPGWIDIQVNGFGGVDYNDPRTPHREITRSLETLFATGVSRFYPTVITGPPDDMAAALRNLAGARRQVENGDAIDGFHVE